MLQLKLFGFFADAFAFGPRGQRSFGSVAAVMGGGVWLTIGAAAAAGVAPPVLVDRHGAVFGVFGNEIVDVRKVYAE